jgi:signal peptidase I
MKENKNGYIYIEKHKKTEKEVLRDVAWTSVFRWVNVLILSFAVLSILFSVFIRIISISGTSMQPTLDDGDVVIYYNLEYSPEIGDIVIIKTGKDDSSIIVKRIIALAGQSVTVDYDKKTVFVDGKVVSEPYVTEMFKSEKNEIDYPYTVPEGHVFVLGDNRTDSVDSRNKNIQAIPECDIMGRVMFKVYPFSEIVQFE